MHYNSLNIKLNEIKYFFDQLIKLSNEIINYKYYYILVSYMLAYLVDKRVLCNEVFTNNLSNN